MRAIAAMLILVTLAGCAGDEPAEPVDDIPVGTASDGNGVIRGVVVDPTIVPVSGATITAQGTDLEAITGDDGVFLFDDVEPGVYFLKATKVGWGDVQQSVEVVANVAAPPVTKIQMEQLPGTEPYAITYKDEGIIRCSVGVPITYTYCGDELGLEDDPHLEYLISGTPDFIQVEIIWKSTQATGDNLYMIQAVCPPENYESCPGQIPAGARWDEGTWQSPAVMRTPDGFLTGAMGQFGASDMEGWWLGVDVSADGPALATGVTIDQSFTGYVTMFWNIEPDEDWTFHENGEYRN